MKQYKATVYVENGYSKIPHEVQVSAETPFAAKELLAAQYGRDNVISIPTEVTGQSSTNNSAPWMEDIG